MTASNLIPNDRGGITYASQQRFGLGDQRCDVLRDVRIVTDHMIELVAAVRKCWPSRYPVPPEIDALLKFHDFAIERLRSGSLKRFAEICSK